MVFLLGIGTILPRTGYWSYFSSEKYNVLTLKKYVLKAGKQMNNEDKLESKKQMNIFIECQKATYKFEAKI